MIETLGPSLIARGYNIIPIQPSRKNPSIRGWQNAKLGAADCARYAGHGVGQRGVGGPQAFGVRHQYTPAVPGVDLNIATRCTVAPTGTQKIQVSIQILGRTLGN